MACALTPSPPSPPFFPNQCQTATPAQLLCLEGFTQRLMKGMIRRDLRKQAKASHTKVRSNPACPRPANRAASQRVFRPVDPICSRLLVLPPFPPFPPSQHLLFHGASAEIRKAFRSPNKLFGYVFLVDDAARVRWRAYGPAEVPVLAGWVWAGFGVARGYPMCGIYVLGLGTQCDRGRALCPPICLPFLVATVLFGGLGERTGGT